MMFKLYETEFINCQIPKSQYLKIILTLVVWVKNFSNFLMVEINFKALISKIHLES